MAEGKSTLDHTLIRVKDFIIIAGAVSAFVLWFMGIIGLPDQVKRQDKRIEILESRAASSDLTLNTMQRDVSYLTKSTDEIKGLLRGDVRVASVHFKSEDTL